MSWYRQIKAQYEENETLPDFDDDDMESYEEQAWDLARDSEINILSDKELYDVVSNQGKLMGALWASWDQDGGFSFDVIVDPKFRGKGIGSELVDIAMQRFNDESAAFENPHYDLDVVNRQMVGILRRKGFVVTRQVGDHILMTMPTD